MFFGHTVHMCGRYRLSRRKQILEEQFAAVPDDADLTATSFLMWAW